MRSCTCAAAPERRARDPDRATSIGCPGDTPERDTTLAARRADHRRRRCRALAVRRRARTTSRCATARATRSRSSRRRSALDLRRRHDSRGARRARRRRAQALARRATPSAALVGKPLTTRTFEAAADAALRGARRRSGDNAFKVEARAAHARARADAGDGMSDREVTRASVGGAARPRRRPAQGHRRRALRGRDAAWRMSRMR